MANERLRALMLERGYDPEKLAGEVGVDTKTAERWISPGRPPHRRHRHTVAKLFRVDESYLWPDAIPRSQVLEASNSEVVTIYPHRSDVPNDVWNRLFSEAKEEIGILVYAGLFLAEDAAIQRKLVAKAREGVRVRVLLGDPDSDHVAQRGRDEGAEGSVAAKIRNALVTYKELFSTPGAEIRLHDTVLYNSIYRADDQVLVNTHVIGIPAARAPVWHLRKIPGGELTNLYLDSFDHVWNQTPSMLED